MSHLSQHQLHPNHIIQAVEDLYNNINCPTLLKPTLAPAPVLILPSTPLNLDNIIAMITKLNHKIDTMEQRPPAPKVALPALYAQKAGCKADAATPTQTQTQCSTKLDSPAAKNICNKVLISAINKSLKEDGVKVRAIGLQWNGKGNYIVIVHPSFTTEDLLSILTDKHNFEASPNVE
ncbi:hypothetical protein CONPUDRAFT_157925 [Coniophora puteana RWD-64-598 SS2]|uniref:Uncharacterized protein n=1 Tax=Coniophora puteana (strain RWD-64-598) TaxID=741705 RepID=A0A5M3MDW7_CONPW|nr:uncharacterized protein CONPUDRAFT_157925 [Coniophora puteana RWD-64-598 SS2]EIW76761.1 hypothetical protein CONPUDRAFT_157925 [Coniophora puteana RWD-64-598 SS2]